MSATNQPTGFLSSEIAETHAAAEAILDATPKSDAADDMVAELKALMDAQKADQDSDEIKCCRICGQDDYDCDCCPSGTHKSLYEAECDCLFEIDDPRRAHFAIPSVPVEGDGRQLNLGEQFMTKGKSDDKKSDDKKSDDKKYCSCTAPLPALDNNQNCIGCKLPDKGMASFSSKPTTTYVPHDIHTPREVILGDKKEWSVSCGRGIDCRPHANDYDIIINLTGNCVKEKHSIPIPELNKWENGGFECTEIMLDWPDYGVVQFPLQFWIDVIAHIEKNKLRLLVFCVGGHGRTGTAVAAMLVAALNYEAKQAINWVRDNYCEKAIESKSQEQYIHDLADENKERQK